MANVVFLACNAGKEVVSNDVNILSFNIASIYKVINNTLNIQIEINEKNNPT